MNQTAINNAYQKKEKTLEKESSIDRCIKVEIDHSNFHEIPVDL